MNRSVLARQMFAKGGAAFPDLNKDGDITQADILMGRGVELKQEGGIAGMMPPDMAPAPGMESMGAQGLDPQIVQGALAEAQQEIGNLDNAQDYATVMNSIRGDDATVEERYAELADIVGEEDAAQTPESVLTLVQPAMAMAAVDQGIGGLAAEEMTEPVQGAMAQGIMSTMAPPPPPAAPPTAPPMMGGPPPANFKDGGLVRRGDNQPVLKFQNAGVVPDISGAGFNSLRFSRASESPFLDNLLLRDIVNAQAERNAQAAARAGLSPAAAENLPERSYDERVLDAAKGAEARYVKAGLGSAESRAAELDEQKKLTQAQMLFDIANTALAFAAPMQGERPGMSPAERLAMAATQTQLPQTIGARAQQQLEAKKAAGKEERALKLAAVQRGEKQVDAEIAAEEAREVARIKAKDTGTVKATKPFLTTQSIVIDEVTYPANTLVNLRPEQVAQTTPDALTPYKADGEAAAKKPYTVTAENGVVFEGQTVERGSTIVVSADEANTIEGFGTSVIPFKASENDKDVNILLPDNSMVTLTPGSDKYVNAITPVSEGGRGGVLAGAKTVDKPLAAKPIDVRRNGKIVGRLDLSLPADRVKYAALGDDVTTHTIGTYNEKDPKNAVWKEIRDGTTGKLLNIVDTTTDEGKDAVETAATNGQEVFNIGTYSEEKADLGTKEVVNTKDVTVNGVVVTAGTPMLLTDVQIAEVKKTSGPDSLRNYEKADKPPDLFGKGDAGKALNYFSVGVTADGAKTIDAYAAGADDPVMDSQIAIYTAAVPDARGLISRRQLPDFVKDAIKKRLLADPTKKSPVPLATLNLTTDELATLQPTQDVPLLNTDGTVNIERATAGPTFIITGLDYTRSQGFTSTLNRVFNQFAGQAAELGLGTGYAGNTGKITSAADKQLKALGRKTITVARAAVDGRVFALDLQLLQDEVEGYYPGGAKTDMGALQQLKTVRSTLASSYDDARFIVDAVKTDPTAFPSDMVGAAKLAMRNTEKLIAEYTAAILAYEANINTSPAAAATAGSSVTSTLSVSPAPAATTGP
jgi:hypothetical protein